MTGTHKPDAMSSRETRPWAAWPVCPRCRQPRQAICPICKVAGSDFPPADDLLPPAPRQDPSGQDVELDLLDDGVLLLCPTCDEAFPPRFYRHCQSCGFEFATGIDLDAAAPDELSSRALLVLTGLALLGSGLLTYFWFVLR